MDWLLVFSLCVIYLKVVIKFLNWFGAFIVITFQLIVANVLNKAAC